ncbi:hypothetical protein MPER_07306 [Moniliophthora perniciosa FA553]|nr:hypothetical protein MPER_07306 [Moniliophthora perniciosa FA553]
MSTPSHETTPDFSADVPLVSDNETFVLSGPEPKDKDEKKKFQMSKQKREDELKERNQNCADRRDDREEVIEARIQAFQQEQEARQKAAKEKREEEARKRKEDDERIQNAAAATAAQQTSDPTPGPQKLSPQEQVAYQLGQQSMVCLTLAPKASGAKKGKAKAREASQATPPDPCITASTLDKYVAQDAKNAVACNQCRKKKAQCSWRLNKGSDLHLVEIEE